LNLLYVVRYAKMRTVLNIEQVVKVIQMLFGNRRLSLGEFVSVFDVCLGINFTTGRLLHMTGADGH